MSHSDPTPARQEGREALRPCPFCGAEATLSGDDHPVWKLARVSCSRCGTGGPGHFHNREAAVLAWNNRPLPLPPARSIPLPFPRERRGRIDTALVDRIAELAGFDEDLHLPPEVVRAVLLALEEIYGGE